MTYSVDNIIIILLQGFFDTRVSRKYFTEFWVTSDLQDSYRYSYGFLDGTIYDWFNFPQFFLNPVWTVLSSPIIIRITINLMFRSFLVLWQDPRTYLSFHFLLFLLCGLLKPQNSQDGHCILFFLIIIWFGLLAAIRWSVWISKYQIILCVKFSGMDYSLCIYHVVLW